MPRIAAHADATALGLFALLCLMWGSGWLALKVGVTALPPLLFAASRFLAAGGALLTLLMALGQGRRLLTIPLRGVVPGALLMFAANYGLMAWGVTRVPSGLAAVVNLATIPLAMAVYGSLYGVSRFTRRSLAGLVLGSCGLAVLLLPPVLERSSATVPLVGAATAAGLLAIAAGASCYAWGSVVTRRGLAHTVSAVELAALQTLIGGVTLLAVSALVEPWTGVVPAFTSSALWGGWGFLVAVTVASTPAYLALLSRWEPSQVATYAYVCPVIAVTEGVLFGGEMLTAAQGAAAFVLGISAWLVLGAPQHRPTQSDTANRVPVPQPAPLP